MKYIATFILLLTLVACGYHFPGHGGALPGDVEKVYIPIFTNETSKPRIEALLSNDVSFVFARNENISQVDSMSLAEATLDGVISSYSTRALSYNNDDSISQYRSTMVIDVALRQVSDGRLLWQGKLKWSDKFLAATDKTVQNDLENEAIREISTRLSEELLSRLLDDF
jgi:outer membrane lipopolysaccharide assembly protein LptE/RlpB